MSQDSSLSKNQPDEAQIAALLAGVPLSIGWHPQRVAPLSIMECVAYVAGKPHGDRPDCACPVISLVASVLNDFYPDTHPSLAQRLLRIAGSRSTGDVLRQRTEYLVDFLLHEAVPAYLDASDTQNATRFRALPSFAQQGISSDMQELAYYFSQAHDPTDRLLLALLQNIGFPKPDYEQAWQSMARLLVLLQAEFDGIALLDNLLAIGNTPALEVTPIVQAHLILLVTNTVTPVPGGIPRQW